MRVILSRVKIKISSVLIVVIFMLLAAMGEMFLPTLLGLMIDDGVGSENATLITTLAIVMGIIAFVAFIANIVAAKVAAKIATMFSADLRSEIFKQVQSFSSAEIDKFGTASLVTRSTSDITNIQLFVTYLLKIGLMAPLMAIAGIALTAATGGRVSSILTVSIPLLLVACSVIVLFILRYSEKLRKKVDEINQLFLENLEGVRVIRAFNKQLHEINRFNKVNSEFRDISIASGRATGLIVPVIEVIFGISIALVMAVGSYCVIHGEMEVGTLVANCSYITMILLAITMFTLVVMLFPTSYTCAKRVAAVLSTETSINDGKKSLADKKSVGTVEFKNVTFSYPHAEEPVLKDISFTANKGDFVAIIGKTGSGKSSILKLIMRFYDVTFGSVLVDGIDVRDYAVSDLRNLIGYVPQKNVLFTGDISTNLNYGNEKGTEKDWKEAASIACADEFIDKKEGTYHSEISQGGTNLSGGQRQRTAIARALMKKAEIYVLDDSLSALDVKTDRKLRENLRTKMSDSTLIMVAQRISSVTDADKILVIDGNEIIGNGTHKELLKTCPLYREIAVLQLGEEAVKNEEK